MVDPVHIFKHRAPSDLKGFSETALAWFRHQATHCAVYKQYIDILGIRPGQVGDIREIPFLPIEFFKTQRIVSKPPEYPVETKIVFTSSGTTGTQQSRHEIVDLNLYERSFREAFEYFYGPVTDRVILALLPSYQEREGSSLIYMVDDLIARSGHRESGYFLNDHQRLYETLCRLKEQHRPTLLLGVTYALLDFAETFTIEGFNQLTIMETGGMKGRRREMIREEVHSILQNAFGRPAIHSEYGMTELLSQAYSKGKGRFYCPPWMQVLIRDTNDPFSLIGTGRTGGINIIDLANYHSCSFIATQDLGRQHADRSFEVLGRFDHSDIRGCNLLVP